MSEDEVSPAVLAAKLDALKETVDHLRTDLADQGRRYVPRDMWETAWKALDDWKVERGIDIADLSAEQARVRRQLDERRHEWQQKIEDVRAERVAGQRWAISVAIAAAAAISGAVATIVNALGLGAS